METSPNKEKLETSSSDVGLHDSSTKWETANSLTSFNDEIVERLPPNRAHQTSVMNISENSQNMSGVNNASTYYDSPGLFPQHLKKSVMLKKNSKKICPMCGKYFVDTSFDDFEIHVESHFIADDEFDSIGENYEALANSIGNNFN
jgi:Autophagy receptor zinc finger-C2H2 domain